MLDQGRLIRVGTLDELRRSINYNYSLKLLSKPPSGFLTNLKGEVLTGRDGNVRILTSEEEAFAISRELSKDGFKFTINPISLDDIFFYLVSQEGGKGIGIADEVGAEEE